MFAFISQCNICNPRMRPFLPHSHNLNKLGKVPLDDLIYQVSKLWGIFSGQNTLMLSPYNLLVEQKLENYESLSWGGTSPFL